MPAYKLASADLKNTILQIEVQKNKPVICTGGGNLDDVKEPENMGNLQQLGNTSLHSFYPVEINDMNFNVINTYKRSLILQSGFRS